jgi:PEP-CTERM motif
MKAILTLAALLAATVATPAYAVVVNSTTENGNTIDVVDASLGNLDVDFGLNNEGVARVDASFEEDETFVSFSSLIDNFIGLNIETLVVELVGASFDVEGDILPAFSAFDLDATATRLVLSLSPGEPLSIALGNVFDDGSDDFVIARGAGSNFAVLVQADVPEPATLALFGFGLAGVAAAARRRSAR